MLSKFFWYYTKACGNARTDTFRDRHRASLRSVRPAPGRAPATAQFVRPISPNVTLRCVFRGEQLAHNDLLQKTRLQSLAPSRAGCQEAVATLVVVLPRHKQSNKKEKIMSTNNQPLPRPVLGLAVVASGIVSIAGIAVADTAQAAQHIVMANAIPQAGLVLVDTHLTTGRHRPGANYNRRNATTAAETDIRLTTFSRDDPHRSPSMTSNRVMVATNSARGASALPPPRRTASSLPPARGPAKPTGNRGLPPPRKTNQRPRPITIDDIKPKPPYLQCQV